MLCAVIYEPCLCVCSQNCAAQSCCTASHLFQADVVPLVTLHRDSRAPTSPFLRKFYLVNRVGCIKSLLRTSLFTGPTCLAPLRCQCRHWKASSPQMWLASSCSPLPLHDQTVQVPQIWAVLVYCDESVDGSKSGCGVSIWDYVSPTQYTDAEVARRLPGYLSWTWAELYAILEALHTISIAKRCVVPVCR